MVVLSRTFTVLYVLLKAVVLRLNFILQAIFKSPTNHTVMEVFDSRYFIINKRLTTWIGLWPYDTGKKYFIRTFWLLAIIFIAIPQIIAATVNSSRPEKVMEHAAVILFIGVVFVKLIALILAESKLKSTCNGIIDNWKIVVDKIEKTILVEYSDRGRKMTTFYLIFMVVSYLSVVIPPITPIILDSIIPLAEPRSRIYLFHGEFLVDKKDYYLVIYLSENFLMFTLVIINLSIDTMYGACVEHCVGIFSIVKYRLRSIYVVISDIEILTKDAKDDKFYDHIVETIKLHQRILNLAQTLDASYSKCFLMLIFITVALGPLACVLVISTLDNPVAFLRFFIGLSCIGVHLFYLCYPGQRLMDVSHGIFEDTYFNQWYTSSAKTKKLLRFIMLRSIKPSLIRAGGVMTMNMENYLIIMKTAMSYITVLASAR